MSRALGLIAAAALLGGCVSYYQPHYSDDGVYYGDAYDRHVGVRESYPIDPVFYPYWSLDHFYFSSGYRPWYPRHHYRHREHDRPPVDDAGDWVDPRSTRVSRDESTPGMEQDARPWQLRHRIARDPVNLPPPSRRSAIAPRPGSSDTTVRQGSSAADRAAIRSTSGRLERPDPQTRSARPVRSEPARPARRVEPSRSVRSDPPGPRPSSRPNPARSGREVDRDRR